MNVQDLLDRNGKKEIPNPNYNPNSKKNTVPPTITVDDLDPLENTSPALLKSIADSSPLLTGDDIKKYERYGINYNRREANLIGSRNLDYQLAEAQSNWEKAGNALLQTVVSEIGLGTIGGFVDMFDFVASKVFGAGEDDYQSNLGNAIRNAQEGFRNNVAPIYQRPGSNIQNGGMGDFGWWMSNIPNIASSLTLLIPARAISGGVSALGKLAGKGLSKVNAINKATNSTRKWLQGVRAVDAGREQSALQRLLANPISKAKIKAGERLATEGMLMRTMENYQESRDVAIQTEESARAKFNEMNDEEFQDWVNANRNSLDNDVDTLSRDAVAKNLAKKAADRTFTMDFSNVVFDILQLYALRNLGVIKNLGKGDSAIIRGAQRKSIADITAKASNEAPKEISKAKKILQAGSDVVKGNAKLVLTESTEGIEEAVNYIAQQEGLTYGKALLDGKDDDYKLPTAANIATLGIANIISTWNNMQNPLNDYLKTAELQESAFWGLMGGITFGALGNLTNRISTAIANKAISKENPITGEIKDKNDWLTLFELPTIKAARTAIEKRMYHLGVLESNLTDIENGIDIYASADENDNKPSFKGDVEIVNNAKALARARAISDFQDQLVMDALSSGTYKMLLEYVKDDKVKQAFIDNKIISKEEADSFIEDFTAKAENIKQVYDRQSSKIAALSTALNATLDNDYQIPIDYIRIFAKRNTDILMGIDTLDKLDSVTEDLIKDAENKIIADLPESRRSEKRTELDNYRKLIKLYVLGAHYGQLEVDIENLSKLPKNVKTQHDIEHFKNQQRRILDYVGKNYAVTDMTNPEERYSSASAFGTVFKFASSIITTENPEPGTSPYRTSSNTFRKTDEQIVQDVKALDIFKNAEIDEATLKQLINRNDKEIRALTGKNSKFKETNSKLYDLYTKSVSISEEREIQYEFIINDRETLNKEKESLDLSYNKAKKRLVQGAIKDITDLYKKYATDKDKKKQLNDAIDSKFLNDIANTKTVIESIMSKEDASKFVNALEALTLTSDTEFTVYKLIKGELLTEEEKNLREQERENSSTSQNPVKSTKKSKQGKSSENGKKSNSESESGQGSNVSPQPAPKPSKTQTTDDSIAVNFVNGEIVEITDEKEKELARFKLTKQENSNMYVLNFKEQPIAVQKAILTKKGNSILFDNPNEIGADVERNPIFRKTINGYELDSPGHFVEQSSPASEEIENAKESFRNSIREDIKNTKILTATTLDEINDIESEFSESYKTINVDGIDLSEDVIRNIIKEEFDLFRNKLRITEEKSNNEVKGTAEEVAWTSIYTESYNDNNTFDVVMTSFMDLINNRLVLRTNSEGKIMLKATDIVRIVSEAYGSTDANFITPLYDKIKQYLDKHNDKYTLIENTEKDVNDIINKTSPVEKDAIERVDIHTFLDNEDTSKEVFDNLSTITVGEELDVTPVENALVIHKGDKFLGQMPFPRIIGQYYVQNNDGIVTKVTKQAGRIYSKDKDIIINLLTNSNLGIVQILNSWIELKHKNINGTDRAAEELKLINAFKNNANIVALANTSIATYKDADGNFTYENVFYVQEDKNHTLSIDYRRIVTYLSRLLEYSQSEGLTLNDADGISQVTQGVENWYSKLYNTYNILTHNTPEKVVVESITDGELINVTSNDILKHYDELSVPSELNIGSNNRMILVNKIKNSFVGSRYGDILFDSPLKTQVAILTNSGSPILAGAVGVKCSDNNEIMKALIDVSKMHLTKRINDLFINYKSKDKIKDFTSILASVIRIENKTGKTIPSDISLFSCLGYTINCNVSSVNHHTNGINLKITKDKKTAYTIYFNFDDNKDLSISILDGNRKKLEGNYSINDIVDFLISNCDMQMNISNVGVMFDVTNQYNPSEYSLFKVSDNKTIDSIYNKEYNKIIFGGREYDSYSDFIIKNNLIKVNIGQEKGRVFRTRGNNLTLSKNLKVSIPGVRAQSIEQDTMEKITLNHFGRKWSSDKNTVDKILSQIPYINQVNAGTLPMNPMTLIELALETVDSSQKDRLIEQFNNLVKLIDSGKGNVTINDLFADSIAYDPNLNAVVNTENGIVEYGPNAIYSAFNKVNPQDPKSKYKRRVYTARNENGESITKSTPTNVRTIIGPKFISMLTSSNIATRNQAIRVLMHEKLHDRLNALRNSDYNKYQQLIDDVEKIYEQYKQKLDNDLKNGNPNTSKKDLEFMHDELAPYTKDKNRRIEEFLVNSLTARPFYQYLNSIESNDKKEKKETLLTKIINFIADIFGFGKINDNSLLRQELDVLNNVVGEVNTESIKEEKENQSNITPITPMSLFDNLGDGIDLSSHIASISEDEETSRLAEPYDSFDNSLEVPISEEIPDYIQEEMQEIRAQAIADGTFMKAPNGNPTNLNERQWLQVRTKAFKNWFGDWESLAESHVNTLEILNEDGSINFDKLEKLSDEYFKNADESLFNKGRKTLRERQEHHKGESNTLEHIQNVVKSAQQSNVSDNLKQHVIIAAALHDLAKPFHAGNKHGFQSEELLNKIFKGKVSGLARFAIAHHMMTIEEGQEFTRGDAERILNDAIKRNLDVNEAIDVLIALHIADITRGRNLEDIDEYSNKSIRDVINTEVENKRQLLKEVANTKENNNVSKVVDENGEPLVVYNNSNIESSVFDKKVVESTYSQSFWFSRNNKIYEKYGKIQRTVFLNARTPLIISDNDYAQDFEDNYTRDNVLGKGFDSIIQQVGKSLGMHLNDIYQVYEPNQIKSATDNIGIFSRDNNDIYDIVTSDISKFAQNMANEAEFLDNIENGEISISCKL